MVAAATPATTSVNQTSSSPEAATVTEERPERPNRRAQQQAKPIAEATMTPHSDSKSAQASGAGRTASNNMSRRRNRINANLLAADELEDKTKTEVTQVADEQPQ